MPLCAFYYGFSEIPQGVLTCSPCGKDLRGLVMMKVSVGTFGGLKIAIGSSSLTEESSRRSKTWTALKYMIAHSKRLVSPEELIDVLWPDQDCSDPHNSLNHVIYRLRRLLSNCTGGIQCIIFAQGMYSWNRDLELEIDAAEFEDTLIEARASSCGADERAALMKKAVSIYAGEYLLGETGDLWLTNFRNFYRNLFLGAIKELADMQKQKSAYEEAVMLFDDAIKIEPYEESLYAQQIELLISIGEYARARQQYKIIEKLLKKEFFAEPSAELQGLWQEILNAADVRNASLGELKTLLDNNARKSAILCGPETFKRIYSYYVYLYERIQLPALLCMLSVDYSNLPDDVNANLHAGMKTLRQIMLRSLRASDIICQYSPGQFVIMITGADKEQDTAPLKRIKKTFEKESDATLSVQVMSIGDGITKVFMPG